MDSTIPYFLLIITSAFIYVLSETRKKLQSNTEEKDRVEKLYTEAIVERDALSKMVETPDPEMKRDACL